MAAELAEAKWVLVAEVIGYDNSQDPDSPLAMARAKAVVKALAEAGVASGRLRSVAGRTTGKDPAYAAVFIVECSP